MEIKNDYKIWERGNKYRKWIVKMNTHPTWTKQHLSISIGSIGWATNRIVNGLDWASWENFSPNPPLACWRNSKLLLTCQPPKTVGWLKIWQVLIQGIGWVSFNYMLYTKLWKLVYHLRINLRTIPFNSINLKKITKSDSLSRRSNYTCLNLWVLLTFSQNKERKVMNTIFMSL